MTDAYSLGSIAQRYLAVTTADLAIGEQLNDLRRPAFERAMACLARDALDSGGDQTISTSRALKIHRLCVRLAAHKGCGTGLGRTFWTRTGMIVLALSSRSWAEPSGPVWGGSNSSLAAAAGTTLECIKKYLPAARRFGFTIPFNGRANHKRRYDARHTRSIAGVSFAPLWVRFEQLEEHVDEWEAANRFVPNAYSAITANIKVLRAAISADRDADRERDLETLDRAQQRASIASRKRDRETLSEITEELNITLPSREKFPRQIAQKSPPNTESPRKRISTVDAWQGARSQNEPQPSERQRQSRSQKGQDYGLDAADVTDTEVRDLFPDLAELCPQLGRAPLDKAAIDIARASGVDQAMWYRACRHLGVRAASIAIMITGQRAIDGEIRTNPNSYLAGILKAADKRTLDLGSSVWGYREKRGLKSCHA